MSTIPLSLDEKQISKEIDELFRGVIEPLKVWMPILNGPSSMKDEYTKDLAYVILLSCLKDTIEVHTKRFTDLRRRVDKSGRASLVVSFDVFESLSLMPSTIFEDMSDNEQILLSLVRDRIVHGYLGGRVSAKDRVFRLVRGNKIERLPVSPAKLRTVIGFFDKVTSHEIRPIRNRTMPKIFKYAEAAIKFNSIYEHFETLEKFFESGAILFTRD